MHELAADAERLGDEPRVLFASVSIAWFGVSIRPATPGESRSRIDRTERSYEIRRTGNPTKRCLDE